MTAILSLFHFNMHIFCTYFGWTVCCALYGVLCCFIYRCLRKMSISCTFNGQKKWCQFEYEYTNRNNHSHKTGDAYLHCFTFVRYVPLKASITCRCTLRFTQQRPTQWKTHAHASICVTFCSWTILERFNCYLYTYNLSHHHIYLAATL